MQSLRSSVKSFRTYVSTPFWVETRIGADEGIKMVHVSFADFSSRKPGKIFRKNSDSLRKKYSQVKVQFRWKIFTGYTLAAL
jgi:hypothetical protein